MTPAPATVTKLHPAKGDPATEAWLTDRKIRWRFEPDLPVDQVDVKGSLANQARLEALDPDVVDRYAADMERGDDFPPLLARQASKRAKQVQLLGGNHRMAAHHKAGHATAPVYVVECSAEQAMRLMYEDNRRHGLPPSNAERVAQAIHLVDTGWTQSAAAECVGITSALLNQQLAAAKADRRARAAGVTGWDQIPKSLRSRLNSLRSDPVFARACEVTAYLGLQQPQLFDLVTRLNETRSDQAALDLLDREVEIQVPASQGGGQRVTPRTKMLSGISHIAGLVPDEVAGACANAEQAKSLGRMIVETQARLKDTLLALKARW